MAKRLTCAMFRVLSAVYRVLSASPQISGLLRSVSLLGFSNPVPEEALTRGEGTRSVKI